MGDSAVKSAKGKGVALKTKTSEVSSGPSSSSQPAPASAFGQAKHYPDLRGIVPHKSPSFELYPDSQANLPAIIQAHGRSHYGRVPDSHEALAHPRGVATDSSLGVTLVGEASFRPTTIQRARQMLDQVSPAYVAGH